MSPFIQLFLLLAPLHAVLAYPSSNATCRCFFFDLCWPTSLEWSTFNSSISGRLIDTIPIGSVCHGYSYNETLCSALRTSYHDPETHYESSSSVMASFWANQSCDVFSASQAQCIKGTYISYAVRVEEVSDIIKTIQFARSKNVRLVVRNTGHDYLGKSTGASSLGLWMHHLRGLEVHDYTSEFYTGKAIKVAAGMLSAEVMAGAHEHGLTTVGGNCPSVGLAGGYTQGGGHGPLTSRYGFGVDQVLEWEVVTVDGELLLATPNINADLYWALSGGGGGTFGIVTSMTVKAYPEERTASANLTFVSAGVSQDVFYEAVEAFQRCLPGLSEAGGVAIYVVQSTVFALSPAMLPGSSKEHLDAMLEPALTKLQALNISYAYTSLDFPTYHDAYTAMVAPSETAYFQIASRALPPQTLTVNATELTQAMREVNSYGAGIGGLSFQAPNFSHSSNSINPKLRSSTLSITIGAVWNNTDWDLNVANQALMTDVLIPAIDSVAPGWSTAYLNEADYREKDWQKVIYGESYDRLLDVKAKYDPNHVLWGRTTVGSEAMAESRDGRLCWSGGSDGHGV